MTPNVATLASALTASLGMLVAYQAYRGYRRNGSEAMGLLALGITCFTGIPFVLSDVVAPALAWSDGLALLSIIVAYNVGLVAILYSLR